MDTYQLLKSPMGDEIRRLFQSCQSNLLISSPYVQPFGIETLMDAVAGSSDNLSIHLLTSLQTQNILGGSLDMGSLVTLCEQFTKTTIRSLPRLHAKVYIADRASAVVTSANLTYGGFYGNYEYGVLLTDSAAVSVIVDDMLRYSALGSEFGIELLRSLHGEVMVLKGLRDEAKKTQTETPAIRAVDDKIRSLDSSLLRNRVHDRTINSIFADTIRYLLTQRPMTTSELYRHIQEIHPDICDDTIDHLINGQNFGRKWKHYVRNAQVFLQRRGDICLTNGQKWELKLSSKG